MAEGHKILCSNMKHYFKVTQKPFNEQRLENFDVACNINVLELTKMNKYN